jgi:hypothetical protein
MSAAASAGKLCKLKGSVAAGSLVALSSGQISRTLLWSRENAAAAFLFKQTVARDAIRCMLVEPLV